MHEVPIKSPTSLFQEIFIGIMLARSLRLAPRLAATAVARRPSVLPRLLPHGVRALSDSGIHDDFKPKKRAYATEGGDVHAQISKDIAENKVVVYMKGVPNAPQCGFSNAIVQVMKAEGVEFKGINVLADPDLREGIKTFTSWPTIPQVRAFRVWARRPDRMLRPQCARCSRRHRYSSRVSSSAAAIRRWRCTSRAS